MLLSTSKHTSWQQSSRAAGLRRAAPLLWYLRTTSPWSGDLIAQKSCRAQPSLKLGSAVCCSCATELVLRPTVLDHCGQKAVHVRLKSLHRHPRYAWEWAAATPIFSIALHRRYDTWEVNPTEAQLHAGHITAISSFCDRFKCMQEAKMWHACMR